jgi:hypothetical protein
VVVVVGVGGVVPGPDLGKFKEFCEILWGELRYWGKVRLLGQVETFWGELRISG